MVPYIIGYMLVGSVFAFLFGPDGHDIRVKVLTMIIVAIIWPIIFLLLVYGFIWALIKAIIKTVKHEKSKKYDSYTANDSDVD